MISPAKVQYFLHLICYELICYEMDDKAKIHGGCYHAGDISIYNDDCLPEKIIIGEPIRRYKMKLICNQCGKEETEPFDVGDCCGYNCGGELEEQEKEPLKFEVIKESPEYQVIDSSEISTKNRTKENHENN